MSKSTVRRHYWENNKNFKEKEKPTQNLLSKHLKKIYPIGLHRSSSALSLSSLSLLSLNSDDSFFSDTSSKKEKKIISSLCHIAQPVPAASAKYNGELFNLDNICEPDKIIPLTLSQVAPKVEVPVTDTPSCDSQKRCNWITAKSDKVYVQFHDECWGVPVYDDNELFELLAMSGMLMDYNWTDILKRRELLREAFSGFDAKIIAKMGEKEIMEIGSNKELTLAETRVRCIVDNAKCILKIVKEFGSFSSYVWGCMNYKPMINKFRHPRNVPLRSPKAEAISKDLLKRGFRFVGPVIVYSFMQAAGLTIDHLIDCFRFGECVNLAERPWRHV